MKTVSFIGKLSFKNLCGRTILLFIYNSSATITSSAITEVPSIRTHLPMTLFQPIIVFDIHVLAFTLVPDYKVVFFMREPSSITQFSPITTFGPIILLSFTFAVGCMITFPTTFLFEDNLSEFSSRKFSRYKLVPV